MAINDYLNTVFQDPINTGANLYGSVIAKQSLDVSRNAYILSQKLYKEFLETHDVEEQRYIESKKLHEDYLDVMQQILSELKLLNENIQKK